jgi:MSHA biogenesis protein MshE
MGAKGYLIAAAIQVILAQRLVRRICSVCKAPATLSAQDKALLAGHYGQRAEGEVFYRGGGCQQCSYTGYRGRSGIYQLLEMDDNMSSALVGEDFLAFKQAALQAAHYQSLERSALDLARKGITSLEEAAKVSSDIGALILKEQLPAQDV